ncbi:unnamed protein product [Trichobilharzia regenti]|nr:unnamed protein product [Trichobilharzia regenti]
MNSVSSSSSSSSSSTTATPSSNDQQPDSKSTSVKDDKSVTGQKDFLSDLPLTDTEASSSPASPVLIGETINLYHEPYENTQEIKVSREEFFFKKKSSDVF